MNDTPRQIEAMARVWFPDAQGRPVYVRRALVPLFTGYAADDDRPVFGAAGPQPHPEDGRTTNGAVRGPDSVHRWTTTRIMRQMWSPDGVELVAMHCAGCGSPEGFAVEWVECDPIGTALIECRSCAYVDRGADARLTVAGMRAGITPPPGI